MCYKYNNFRYSSKPFYINVLALNMIGVALYLGLNLISKEFGDL